MTLRHSLMVRLQQWQGVQQQHGAQQQAGGKKQGKKKRKGVPAGAAGAGTSAAGAASQRQQHGGGQQPATLLRLAAQSTAQQVLDLPLGEVGHSCSCFSVCCQFAGSLLAVGGFSQPQRAGVPLWQHFRDLQCWLWTTCAAL